MYRILFFIACFALLTGCQPTGENSLRQVTVSGSSTIEATPDRAVVELGIEIRDKDVARARESAEQVVARAVKALESLGIPADAIDSGQIISRPERVYREDGWEDVGFYVARSLEVSVDELDKLGRIYDGATAAGMTTLSPPRLAISDPRSIYRQALDAAALDARSSAEQLATSLGHDIGKAIEITEQGGASPMPPAMAMRADAEAIDTRIETGEMTFNATVQVTFELID